MIPKDLISQYYKSDLANDLGLVDKYYHENCKVFWNSSKGYKEMDFQGVRSFFKGVTESYNTLRFQLSHLLADGHIVTARYTLHANTIESDDEIPIAHYVCIFHIKDGKIYRAYEMSQPADEKTIASDAFS